MFYAINIAANMVISSQKFFKADRYRYVVPIFLILNYSRPLYVSNLWSSRLNFSVSFRAIM